MRRDCIVGFLFAWWGVWGLAGMLGAQEVALRPVPKMRVAEGSAGRGQAAEAALRPLGAPSLVDQLRQVRSDRNATAASKVDRRERPLAPHGPSNTVRRTAWMQSGGLSMTPDMAAPPLQPERGGAGSPVPPPGDRGPTEAPRPSTSPRLQPTPLEPRPLPQPRADLQPVAQPSLDTGIATVDNCSCVSAPSGYSAGGFYACSPAYSVVPCGTTAPAAMPYTTPTAVIAPPPGVPRAGCPPLITLGQDLTNVQIGQGIIGQPKAYVPGQSIRNFFRYFTP